MSLRESWIFIVEIYVRWNRIATATKLISRAREDGSDETTKAFTRLTPNSFKANCPQRGCKLPLSADVYAHALSGSPRLLRASLTTRYSLFRANLLPRTERP